VARELAARGDLKRSETLWGETFVVHQDMLWQYESTLGNFKHRKAGTFHKLAEHYIRRQEHGLAQ
jgi:hypothetical protein